MIRNILLPTDFSSLACRAASAAREIAESHAASIHVLHVREPGLAAAAEPMLAGGAVLMMPAESELNQAMDAFVQTCFSRCGVPVSTALRVGRPSDVIARYARDMAIDVIVIGTHARGIVRRLVHGSISKSVMERCGRPVLMVPPAQTGVGA